MQHHFDTYKVHKGDEHHYIYELFILQYALALRSFRRDKNFFYNEFYLNARYVY